ncbi:MAG: hypothetical protein WCL14_02990 [Bacteroidota bacterium]
MNANEILNNFKEEFKVQSGCEISSYLGSNNIIKVKGKINCILYIKVAANESKKAFWGIRANKLNELKNEKLPGIVILLLNKSSFGYIVKLHTIDKLISNYTWTEAQGDYKVNGIYGIEDGNFSSLNQLLIKLENTI